MTLHKQNYNAGEIENDTNEKIIRKTGKKWTLVEMRGSISFALMIRIHFTSETEVSENQYY